MIPILFDSTETSFTSNGLGRLSECLSCEVTEERNGVFECVFTYPITGAHYNDITVGKVIYCTHDETRQSQPFDIYKKSVSIDGIATYNARHISYRLNNVILDPFTAGSCADAFAKIPQYSVTNNPFSFNTDKVVSASFAVKYPSSVRQILGGETGSILDVFGTGEYKFDKFNVYFYLHRGTDTDVEIRYGKNLTEFNNELNYETVYNAVAPYWYSAESGELVTLPEKVLQYGTGTIVAVPLDLSSDFEEMPTVADLRTKATSRLNNSEAWEPNDNFEIDFVALWQTPEYEDVAPLQRLRLCDTVKIVFPAAGFDARAKIISVTYDSLNDKYTKMELGNAKRSFADTLRDAIAETVLTDVPSNSMMQVAINHATDLITGGTGGYVVIGRDADGRPNEILIMDSPDKATAVNVWRFNSGGLGHSSNGYEGPYSDLALTMDGQINADMITTGSLSANRIGAGIIQSLVNGNYWDLTSGIFRTGYNTRSVKMDNGVVYFYNESLSSAALGSIYMDTRYLSMSAGAYGVKLQRTVGNTSNVILLIRGSSETESGYSEDAICYRNWRFVLAAVFQSGLSTAGSITFTSNSSVLSTVTGSNSMSGLKASKDFVVGGNAWLTKLGVGISTYSIQSGYIAHVNGSLYVGSTMSAQTVTQRSDERQKNIEEWDDRYTELLDDLEPIIFRWKDSEDKHQHVGLGARHTKKLLEEKGLEDSGFVHVDDDDEHSIVYSELTVMLLKKVQEQQKIIDDLVTRIEALERRVSE